MGIMSCETSCLLQRETASGTELGPFGLEEKLLGGDEVHGVQDCKHVGVQGCGEASPAVTLWTSPFCPAPDLLGLVWYSGTAYFWGTLEQSPHRTGHPPRTVGGARRDLRH